MRLLLGAFRTRWYVGMSLSDMPVREIVIMSLSDMPVCETVKMSLRTAGT